MVDIILNGRLGNQLFMYAMGRKLQLEYKKSDLYFNTSLVEDSGFKNSLIHYNISENINFYNDSIRTRRNVLHGNMIQNLKLMKYFKNIIGLNFNEVAKYEDSIEKKYKKKGLFICRDRYKNYLDINNTKCIIAYGYFQSSKYFDDIREILLNELTPKEDILEKNKNLYENICNSNSVCVSVRLGDDFLNNDIYNVCTLEYYKKAIRHICDNISNPKFFIFSDKPNFLKHMFKDLEIDMVFESGNDPDYEKLRIMSACKHFILANSSFSWWCQYLSTYEDKIVVAPYKWYNGDVPCDIYMDSWKLIEF